MRLFIPSVVVRFVCAVSVLLLFAACQSDEQKLDEFRERGAAYFEEGQFKEAIIEFKNVLKIDPNDAEAHHQLARSYIANQKFREAFWELNETVRLDPSNKDARLTLTGLSLLIRDYEEVLRHAEAILELYPDNAGAWVAKGQALVQMDRMEEAEAAYLQAIEVDPEQGASYGLLANLYTRQDNPEAAEAALVKYTEKSPNFRSFSALARFLARSDESRWEEAVEVFEKTLTLAENSEERVLARQNLATFYLRRQEVDKAIALMKQGIEEAELDSDGKLELIYALARVYHSQGQTEKADDLVEAAVAAQPDAARPYLTLSSYRSYQGDFDGALQAVEDALRVEPENSRAKLRKAELLADLGFREKDEARIVEARALVEQVLQSEPSSPDANFVVGKIHLAEGNRDEAVVALRSAIDGRPEWAQARYVLGSTLMLLGENVNARAELARAVEIDPELLEARRLLARLHTTLGEHEYAIEQARAYLSHDPEDPGVRVRLAQSLVALGRVDEAIAELESTSGEARNVDVLFALGRLYLSKRNVDKARELLLAAQQMAPNQPEILESLMRIDYSLGKIEESQARIAAAIAAEPDNARLMLVQGRTALRAGDPKMAEASFKRAIELDASLLPAYEQLAALYQILGRLDETIETYKAALVTSPDSPKLNQFVAVLYERSGNIDVAIQYYEKAISLDPGLGQAKNNLAYLLAEQERDLDRALDLAQSAKALMPESPNAADTLGWVLFKRGMASAAIGYLKEAVANSPADSEYIGVIRFHLAQAYAADDQKAKAIQELELLVAHVESRMSQAREQGSTPREPDWSIEARQMLERLKSAG
jgi:tetratricopeptide (TPR) repeat protein